MTGGWKIAGALTLAHSLAGAAPPPSAPATHTCSVIMMNNKTVVAATLFNAVSKKALYTSTALDTIENGHRSGMALDVKGNEAGKLTVKIHPKSEDNTVSLRPQSCSFEGKDYPVIIPDNINRRLFSPEKR